MDVENTSRISAIVIYISISALNPKLKTSVLFFLGQREVGLIGLVIHVINAHWAAIRRSLDVTAKLE